MLVNNSLPVKMQTFAQVQSQKLYSIADLHTATSARPAAAGHLRGNQCRPWQHR